MPRWFSNVMRVNSRLAGRALVWALAGWISLSAHGQLSDSRKLPIPETESSPTTSSESLPDPATLQSASTSAVLPIEQAFQLTALFEGDTSLLLSWQIAPGHYLYRDKFRFLDLNDQPLTISLPPGVTMVDEYFGNSLVYFDSLQLRTPLAQLQQTPSGEYLVKLRYQGCAKDKYCYPPAETEIRLTLPR